MGWSKSFVERYERLKDVQHLDGLFPTCQQWRMNNEHQGWRGEWFSTYGISDLVKPNRVPFWKCSFAMRRGAMEDIRRWLSVCSSMSTSVFNWRWSEWGRLEFVRILRFRSSVIALNGRLYCDMMLCGTMMGFKNVHSLSISNLWLFWSVYRYPCIAYEHLHILSYIQAPNSPIEQKTDS